jgi:hypothetical protein
MSFAVHTFETNPAQNHLGFAFHENVGEGQEIYFLGKFHESTGEPKSVAETIFGAIVDTFERNPQSDPYDRFEDALKNANREMKKLSPNLKKTPDLVIAFFDFHNLYLTQSGDSEVYLLRNSTVSQISEAPENGDSFFLNILSGQVTLEDTILLTSTRLLRVITHSQLADMFARSNFDDAVRSLRQHLSLHSEEPILLSAIGIGKKSNIGSAGFLSKMVSKISHTEILPQREEVSILERPEGSLAVEEREEVFEEEYEEVEMPYKKTEESLFSEDDFAPEPEEMNPTRPTEDKMSAFRKPSFRKSIPLPKQLPSRRKMMIIAGSIFSVLVVVLGVRWIMNFESASEAVLREQLDIAREARQQADTFLLQGDRQAAGEQLEQAREAVKQVLSSDSRSFRSDAQFLLADIEEKQLQVENAKKGELNLVADFSTKNDAVDAIGLLDLRGTHFGYDKNTVYKTVRNLVEKGIKISEKENIVVGGILEDQNTLVFLTDLPRIIEYKDGIVTPMTTDDATWKNGLAIQTYGKYLYVLDPVENQIWKYERSRSKYTGASPYNKGADLSQAVSFAIDGAVYVLSADGSIQKTFRGEKADFRFRDLPSKPFSGNGLKIYTNANLDYLYILDPDNSRILIFTKGDQFATYKKQILFDLPGVKDFAIDDAGQRATVIAGDKTYEVSL